MTNKLGPFEMSLLFLAPLIVLIKLVYNNEVSVIYFFSHTFPILLGILVGGSLIIWLSYYFGKKYFQKRKEEKEKLEKRLEAEEKQAEEDYTKLVRETNIQKFKESLIDYQHLLVGDMTEERKKQLGQAVKILSKKEGDYNSRWKLLKPFREAMRRIDEHLVNKDEMKEQHLQIVESSLRENSVYKKTELGDEEIEVLTTRMHYQEYTSKPLNSQRTCKYLVHPRNNESPEHFLLVKQLEEYLELVVHDISTPESRDADIIFKINKEKYALEIETGSNLKSKRKELQEKIKTLNRKYKDNWFIVVTHRDLISKYQKYCLRVFNRASILEQLNEILAQHGREFPAKD
jgi:hypothetical protein